MERNGELYNGHGVPYGVQYSVPYSIEYNVQYNIEYSVQYSIEYSVQCSIQYSVQYIVQCSVQYSVEYSVEYSVHYSVQYSYIQNLTTLGCTILHTSAVHLKSPLPNKFTSRSLQSSLQYKNSFNTQYWFVYFPFSCPHKQYKKNLVIKSIDHF
jgi:hypothetical protein